MSPKNLYDFPDIIDAVSRSLFLDLEKYQDQTLFERFFIERAGAARDLSVMIQYAEPYGYPLFLIGDRGVGKSTFLRWFWRNPKYSGIFANRSMLFDLHRTYNAMNADEFKQIVSEIVVKNVKEYLKEVDECHDITSEANKGHWMEACELATGRVLQKSKQPDPLILFVDDIDWVEEKYFPLLMDCFREFLSDTRCCPIIAARKPAYNFVRFSPQYPWSKSESRYFRDLELKHLDVEEVLEARCALVFDNDKRRLREIVNKSRSVIKKIRPLSNALRSSFTRDSGSQRVSNQNDDNMEMRENALTMKYPFTCTQYGFMQENSNGNVSYMLEMAKVYLEYIRDHPEDIKEADDGYYIQPRQHLELFSRCEWEPIRICNVHEIKSYGYLRKIDRKKRKIPFAKLDNSLLVLMMELLRRVPVINETSRQFFKDYQFSLEEVKDSIGRLKETELIGHKRLPNHKTMGGYPKKESDHEYELTRRGIYYLEYLIPSQAYCDEFGQSKHHKLARPQRMEDRLQYYLLEFLIKIMLTRQNMNIAGKDFRVAKNNFLSSFSKLYRESIAQIFRTDPSSKASLVTKKMITDNLTKLDVIKTYTVIRQSHYLFFGQRVEQKWKDRGFDVRIVPPYVRTIYENLVKTHVQKPEYEIDEERRKRRRQ